MEVENLEDGADGEWPYFAVCSAFAQGDAWPLLVIHTSCTTVISYTL